MRAARLFVLVAVCGGNDNKCRPSDPTAPPPPCLPRED